MNSHAEKQLNAQKAQNESLKHEYDEKMWINSKYWPWIKTWKFQEK